MKSLQNQTEYEFIIDGCHYFIPTALIKSFANKIQDFNQYSTYRFENLIDPERMFNLIVDLFYGKSIDIDKNNAFFLGFIADNLGIAELSEATNFYRQIELTPENIFEILHQLDTYHITDSRIMKYVSQNWPLLSKSENILHLSFFTLNEIFLQNPEISLDFELALKIIESNCPTIYCSQNEDEIETVQLTNEFIQLLAYCDFSQLSLPQIDEVFSLVSFDAVRPKILEKLAALLGGYGTETKTKTKKESESASDPFSYASKTDSKEKAKEKEKSRQKQSQTNSPIEVDMKQLSGMKTNKKSSQGEAGGVAQSAVLQNDFGDQITNQKKLTQKESSKQRTQTQESVHDLPQSSHQTDSSNDVTYPSSGVAGSRYNKPTPSLPSPSSFVSIDYESGFELFGVVSVFQERKPSNWKDEVVVCVPEGSKFDFRYNLFDRTSRSWWSNYDGRGCFIEKAWIVVGFPNYTLRMTYYTLASKEEKPFFSQPMSWVIYGSDNPNKFSEEDVVERVKNAPSMNVPRPMKTFKVSGKSKPYSYFKFVLVKNFSPKKLNEGELTLSGLELFGILTAK